MGYSISNFFEIMSGATMIAAWVSGLFFLKFWIKSRERLFLWFAVSFWAMALERFVIGFLYNPRHEDYAFVYLIRLFAFALIVFAILDTNRKRRKKLDK